MGYSKEELKVKKDKEELEKLKKEFLVYNEKLLNKEFLLIFCDITNKTLAKIPEKAKVNLKNLKAISVSFGKENFTHLVGIPKAGKKLYAVDFYDKLKKNKILRSDYETSICSELKGEVFNKIPNIFKQMSIIASYNYEKQQFKVDKILGGTKKIPDVVLGLKERQIKGNLIEEGVDKYIPASLLNAVTEDLILKGTERKILYTLEKNISEKLYKEITFVHRDFPIDNLYNDKRYFDLCYISLQEKIKENLQIKL